MSTFYVWFLTPILLVVIKAVLFKGSGNSCTIMIHKCIYNANTLLLKSVNINKIENAFNMELCLITIKPKAKM